MNWSRGFKRVWYFILGIIWILALFTQGASYGPAAVGEATVYLLVFSLFWQLFGAAILWVARGFRKDAPQPGGDS